MKALSPLSAAALRGCGTLLAPGGRRGSLLVLIFHRVLAQPDPLLPGEPDVARFAAQMDLVRSVCRVLPLAEAVERLYAHSLPPRAACITFDDGYANNLTHAAPVLSERGLPATVFVASGYLGGGRMWNDTVIEAVRRAGAELDLSGLGLGHFTLTDTAARRRAIDAILDALKYRPQAQRAQAAVAIAERVGAELPSDLMLTQAQLAALARFGLDVGAHTVTHPILTRVDAATARREIASSRAVLQELTGTRVPLFAFPNGRPVRDYEREHVAMVREAGFSAAVSTAPGACRASSDPFQLSRVSPWDRTATRYAVRLVRTYAAPQAAHV
jgi:peptidoglycan/xylan/chitin deacetylase (PgdA/CDA1 family)